MFTRCWCVAECAVSFKSGVRQRMKLLRASGLEDPEIQKFLKGLKMRNMEATRPEDVKEILDKIGDDEAQDAFDAQLQELIFERLTVQFRSMDAEAKLQRIGRLVRTYLWKGNHRV